MMNGGTVSNVSTCRCALKIGKTDVTVDCLVSKIVPGYGALLGMDVIGKLGGVVVSAEGKVGFSVDRSEVRSSAAKRHCAAVADSGNRLSIKDKDFEANFVDGRWEVSWTWLDAGRTPRLQNHVGQYGMAVEVESAFNDEIEEWIQKGWLQPYDGDHDGLIPLLAVVQQNKEKIRPVLDFRELNEYVSSHTGQKFCLW